jgi:predicted deacylase
MYTIETKKAGPKVLLLAGVHGDEYEPILAALKLIDDLPAILKSGTVTIVPMVNESAYENGTRSGIDGLDLARVCPGRPDGTDTEKAASRISGIIRKSDYLIDMHTGGLAYDIYPLVGYMLHPSPEILKQQQEMAIAFKLPLVWGTDYRPNGRTLSIARDANIPAIYLEYGGGTGIRENVVSEYSGGFLNVLKYLKMIDGTVDNTGADLLWVEDHRPDSGHLQQKMPSPVEGIFISAVRIGDQVKKGQLFGRVIDAGSNKSFNVYTDQNGLVFLLRTLVKVKKGDALGGVMPAGPGKNKIVYE